MEQLKNPQALMQSARDRAALAISAQTRAPLGEAAAVNSANMWQQLAEAQLDLLTLRHNNVVTAETSVAAAPFDVLRTQTLRHLRKTNAKRLAITSPTRGCGSSTVTVNLALSFARKADLRTLIFDFDLRQPKLIHLFGLVDRGPRYSALQGGRSAFDNSCLRVGEGLGLSLNATPSETPAELLGAQDTKDLIKQIEEDYAPDLIVFDLPPLLAFDDALAALDLADSALLIAGADHSTIDEIDEAERVLSDYTSCLGTVLNKCRFSRKRGLI